VPIENDAKDPITDHITGDQGKVLEGIVPSKFGQCPSQSNHIAGHHVRVPSMTLDGNNITGCRQERHDRQKDMQREQGDPVVTASLKRSPGRQVAMIVCVVLAIHSRAKCLSTSRRFH
jgi:hypothetical protein